MSLCIASIGDTLVCLAFNNSLLIARLTIIALFASSKPSLYLLIVLNVCKYASKKWDGSELQVKRQNSLPFERPSSRHIKEIHTSSSVGLDSGPFPRLSSFSSANVALSLEYPHRLIRASMPCRTAVANSVLARISSETLSRDGILCS